MHDHRPSHPDAGAASSMRRIAGLGARWPLDDREAIKIVHGPTVLNAAQPLETHCEASFSHVAVENGGAEVASRSVICDPVAVWFECAVIGVVQKRSAARLQHASKLE